MSRNPTTRVWPYDHDTTLGDAAWYPAATRVEPHADGRLPFDRNGELRASGPQLPDGYLEADDVEGIPWIRDLGQAWTTPELRTAVKAWLAGVLAARPSIRSWRVEEMRRGMRTPAWPEDQWGLRLVLDVGEVAFALPRHAREGAALAAILERVEASIDAL